ncbi:MAG: lipopolysaccharide transport periplasmic protein LptA [Bacteroidia bacterium]|nr:MAG: lipopolysaccharide transport periplasmic protein LptA [Bacteroidia bacterium]
MEITVIKMRYILLIFFLFLHINLAMALKGDDKEPLILHADNAIFDQLKKITTFTGNVVITRGTLIVHSNKGVGTEDASGARVITLYGTPVTFEQLQDDGEKVYGQGNEFNYFSKTGIAILTGRARVRKGKNMVIGDKITYDSKSQTYTATSTNANGINSNKSGRVTVILDQVKNDNKTSH